MAKPNIPHLDPLYGLGIDPKTGKPLKATGTVDYSEQLQEGMLRLFRDIDIADYTNRYKWSNLPDGITGELIERMLYYRGQIAFFYQPETNCYYILPYATEGPMDVYGRPTGIVPLTFQGTASTKGDKQEAWIPGMIKKPIYAPKIDLVTMDDVCKDAVILYDRTRQMPQMLQTRQSLNEPILRTMSTCVPYMNTSMMLSTGVKGMRVNDGNQAQSVLWASQSLQDAALKGQGYVPIVGNLEFQELAQNGGMKGTDYMQCLQLLDNLRLSTLGLQSGGLYEKQGTVLQSEQALNGGKVELIYQDGLNCRQQWCNITNSIFGTTIWCEPTDAAMGGDFDRDGAGYDNQDPLTQGGQVDGGNDNVEQI